MRIDEPVLVGFIMFFITAIHFGLGVYFVWKKLFDEAIIIYATSISLVFFLSMFLYLLGFAFFEALVAFVLLLTVGTIYTRIIRGKSSK